MPVQAPLAPGLLDVSRTSRLLQCLGILFPGALELVQHSCLWKVRSPVILPVGVDSHLYNREDPDPPAVVQLQVGLR